LTITLIPEKAFSMIITVFRSRLRDEWRAEYMALASKISGLAKGMPGHLSHKSFVAEDGERVTIIEFKDRLLAMLAGTWRAFCNAYCKR
jgi:antibiotic biosynthesis monooxygenase (ABM) superfamily enzyme